MPIMSRLAKVRLARRLQPGIYDAFGRSILAARKLARATAVYNAIEESDPADVIRAMGISEARFLLDFIEGLRGAYIQAGQSYMDAMPARVTRPFGGRFDFNTPSASQFLGQYSAKRVKQITQDQREAIRAFLQVAQANGMNPRTIALDMVGRGSLNNRRGGIIGITKNQAQWALNARLELESGEPGRMRAYLSRKRRDRRFDGIVQRSIAAGARPDLADIDRIVTGYAEELRLFRAQTIARTESAEAVGNASLESLKQAVNEGTIPEDGIKRTWRSASDERVRSSHQPMDGQERFGLDEPFTFPGGAHAMFPGDSSFGAPPGELINCRCWSEEDFV